MGFEDACSYLEALGVDAMKSLAPSIHRIEALCDALDNPQAQVPAIHISGTNGKTSTARIASSVLAASGLAIGAYTSPHVQSIRERLSLNGKPIDAATFGDVFDHVFPYVQIVEAKLGEPLTYFEILTAMYFLWAAETPVDASVVEVGLGGTWDATNVIKAPVAVITNVQLDHTRLLGSDRPTIAREKAGIIKPGATVVTAERTPDVLGVIAEQAQAAGADMAVLDRDFAVLDNRVAFGGRYLSVRTSEGGYEGLYLPLHGAHQGTNAATALQAVAGFLASGETRLGTEVVAEGLAETRVPGRLETVRVGDDQSAPVLLDVAHNPDGMSALISSLLEAFAFDRVRFVIGILDDKDYMGMLAEIARVPASLIATQAKTVRSVPLDRLVAAAEEFGLQCEAIDDVADAVKHALDAATDGELVCVTGSHYVVGEARDFLVASPDV
jgi:dihydrofolate synthase/folylpolyglutamate synthase